MRHAIAAAFAFSLAACASAPAPTAPVTAEDPHLWLEEIEGEQALDWVRAQNARSLPVLENDPRYPGLLEAALEVAQSRDRLPLGQVRGGYLYNFWQDPDHVRGIWRRATLDSYAANAPRWETVLDIDALARAENANWVWQGAECDPSGVRCMISLSNGGLDAATEREFDLTTRGFVENGFVIPEAKSNFGWLDRDTLLVATNWGEGALTESGYPFVLKAWRRGTPLASAVEILRGEPRDVSVSVATFEDESGDHIAIAVEAETFFETVYSLITPEGPVRLTLPRKSTIHQFFNDRLIVTLEEAWSIGGATYPSGSLLALPLSHATLAAPRVEVVFTPTSRQSIGDVEATRDGLLAPGFDNVRGRLWRFTYDDGGWRTHQVQLPPTGVVSVAGASTSERAAFFTFEDFLTPPTLYALSGGGAPRAVRSLPAQFDASPYVTEQFEATSADGTRVPYFVVRRRDMQLNGQNPTLLYAYGGFQLSQVPSYNAYVGRLWLDQGGTYVLANIRGGGEFGPAWHDAGLLTNRQRIYDDFYAVERDLVARNITSPRRLGISGRSNGGLLMGVMLNQHPEMVHAAIIGSPLLDMLRYDQLLAGASWVGEYGSPAIPEQRAFLETITPYQNLRARDDFPTVFIYTSTKDDRVHPGHARKYGARLDELGIPYLYYENTDGGHSANANLREAARRRTLEYMYLTQRLID
ncbi:prolyl oligopeptidase family serine peptidase [Vitreimonas sp.]|uniref:prolyl oligopeptidase family serine peptidase n=1 Tax=Vitreimonas sp. TaxID=3069702 RepID=UPI002ED8D538